MDLKITPGCRKHSVTLVYSIARDEFYSKFEYFLKAYLALDLTH